MEYHSYPKNDSREQQSSGSLESNVQAQASQGLELQEKPDLHDSVTGKVKDVPPQPSRNQKRQQIYRKAAEEEEVVKFMSSVPGYLERGEKPQEKVLNVGVLDWGLLEKWQYNKKQSTCKSSTCSPSSSNLSTDGSSIDSTRRHSSSPSRERIRHLSLQYHLMASPIGGHSSASSSEECVGKFQDPEAAQSSFADGKFKFVSTDQPFSYKLVVTNPKISKESRAMEKKLSYRVVSTPQQNMKAQDGEYARKAEMLQEHKSNNVGQDVPQRPKTVVGVSQVSGLTNMFVQRSAEASRISFSEISQEAYDVEVKSGIPHSCPLISEANSNGGSYLEQPSSIDAESVKFPPALRHSVSRSAKKGTSPSRGRNLQETNPTIAHSNSIEKELSKKLNMKSSKAATEKPSKQMDVKASEAATLKATKETDLKASKAAVEKPRSTSPLLRFSMGMAKISKSSGHKECLTAPQFASSYISVKSGPENVVVSTSLDYSSNGGPESTARARTSPLRRLLDPLIKPKAVNCHQFSEPSLRGYVSTETASRSPSNGLLDSSAEHLGKGKSELNDSCQGKKQRSSTFRALLRVAFKNGLPLFTFTVDNDSEILAATLKSSTSEKEEQRSIYTFFNIREVKKKRASWITQGGKEKGPNYIPDIVAQMKVFDVQPSNLTWPNSVDHFRVKEYVLFSVELGEEDQGTSNFKPNDEFAAIVVKMPKKMQRNSIGNGCESNNYNQLSGIGLEECFPGVRRYSYSGDNRQNSYLAGIQESISTTVILPSDVHSLPSKGEPSSLVHRWRSGGSCDCGGWDLGCKLKILANSNQQLTKKLSSSSIKDQFELFSQDGREENQPALSLAPFKDGIFSVEFNPSLSFLQAFSTCIAILDSWKPCELSFSSDMFEEKASGETIQVRDGDTRILKHVEENHPTKYVSFPPLSPVGRV